MRKLIYQSEIGELVCDNPECDFRCEIESKKYHEAINARCPKCEENLLTLEDYNLYLKTIRIINKINKWFGWISIFIKEPKEKEVYSAHFHKGTLSLDKKDKKLSETENI